jgi:hypothetical protein
MCYALHPSDVDYRVINYNVNKVNGIYHGRSVHFITLPSFTELCMNKSKTCNVIFEPTNIMFNLDTADYSQRNTLRGLDCGAYLSPTFPPPLIIDIRATFVGYCFYRMYGICGMYHGVGSKYNESVTECTDNPLCIGITKHSSDTVYEHVYGKPYKCDSHGSITIWTNKDILDTWNII